MLNHISKGSARPVKHPVLGKLAIFTAVCLILKLAAGSGAEAAAERILKKLAVNSTAVTEILSLELGRANEKGSTLELLASQSTLLDTITGIEPASQESTQNLPNEEAPVQQTATSITPEEQALDYHEYPLEADGIEIKNKTDYTVEPASLLAEELNIHINSGSPQVLIIHTHGSEAYYPDGDDIYEASDPSRTENKNYNMIRVGDRLSEFLEKRGISVLHDRELYDYPSYTGSYTRSMESIEEYLNKYPDIKVVIDLHRDALEESDGTIHRTSAEINDTICSQVLLIVGSSFSGLEHPDWQENLKFALHLQADMNDKYPGLTRPVTISQYRYNQHATTGSLIVEIGCTGNTLQESLTSVEYFADCLGDVLLRYSAST